MIVDSRRQRRMRPALASLQQIVWLAEPSSPFCSAAWWQGVSSGWSQTLVFLNPPYQPGTSSPLNLYPWIIPETKDLALIFFFFLYLMDLLWTIPVSVFFFVCRLRTDPPLDVCADCMDCKGQKVIFCHSEFLHNVWVSWIMSHFIASIDLIPVLYLILRPKNKCNCF